ncbi:AGAP005068-PA-like protein [Anopheles sinensis]|uniref:AGAP005068-PA-like protein n=1 Tax=Anopheles sinensis TaxID=74873 RepID=A0A084WJD0_ANOSI|nr:AGAP005068-PA-like protein [Anopheles sinensis]
MLTTTTDESDALQPYFDFDVNRNLTITVGQTGFLHCRVERLGDKDLLRPANSVNWTLQIKYPQTRDSGVYECQINTEPKLSLSYVLNVIELRARILGPSDIFIKSGSEITIVCVIQRGPHELGLVFWYKGSSLLEPHTQENNVHPSDEGRITIETDWTDVLTSRSQEDVPKNKNNQNLNAADAIGSTRKMPCWNITKKCPTRLKWFVGGGTFDRYFVSRTEGVV